VVVVVVAVGLEAEAAVVAPLVDNGKSRAPTSMATRVTSSWTATVTECSWTRRAARLPAVAMGHCSAGTTTATTITITTTTPITTTRLSMALIRTVKTTLTPVT
jgi:hypothetical protein